LATRFFLVLSVLCYLVVDGAFAQDPDAEAKYTAAITKRADDIVVRLEIADPSKATQVRDQIMNQYRALREFHDANEAVIIALKTENPSDPSKLEAAYAPLKELHRSFISGLERDLTAEQLDTVKNGMTFNVLNVTYTAYLDKIPSLTDEQKLYIMQQLTEARELAMDEGSSEAKHNVFGKYKGRINNYLSQAGYDLRAEEKAWQERLRARRAAATQKSE